MTSPYSFLQLMSHIYGIVSYYLEPGEAFPLRYASVPLPTMTALLSPGSIPYCINPHTVYLYSPHVCSVVYYLGSFFGWLAKRSLARKFYPL